MSDWDRLGPVGRVPTWMKNGAKMLGGDEGIRGGTLGGNNNDNKTWMING